MTIDVTEPGPWLDASDERIRDLFVEHMRRSAFPEHFEGVAANKPPEDGDPRIIIKHISVDPTKRGGAFALCNICGAHPKWKHEGMLVCIDGWLYIIGPVCGENHFPERFRDASNRYDRNRAEVPALSFLMANAQKLAQLYASAKAIGTHVEAASETHSLLRKTNSPFSELRRVAINHGGWLQVEEKHYDLDQHGKSIPRWDRVDFAPIHGLKALQIKCKLKERLGSTIGLLSEFGDNEDTAFVRIEKAMAEDEIPELANRARIAQETVNELIEEICEFKAFFSEENFKTLGAWAAHRGCPIQLTVECYRNSRALTAKSARRRIPIDVTALMHPLPEEAQQILLDEAS